MNTDRDYSHAEHDRRIANVARVGTIDSVDLAAGRVRVRFDADWVGDDLPWMEPRAGSGMRTWSAPVAGEQVLVISPSGETTAAVALRGLFSDATPAPSSNADLSILGLWSDQAQDSYDAAAHARVIALPVGGALSVTFGGQEVLALASDKITLTIGGSQIMLQDGSAKISATTVELDGDVALGAGGGQPVARVGDPVSLNTGLILHGSMKVTAG